jgi:pimeloyl-ACP methyl ester carboxylesterase
MLEESARTLSRHYQDLSVPVRIIAGLEDRIVETDNHSARLHRELGTSKFLEVPRSGHMVHHTAPAKVLAAISDLSRIRKTATDLNQIVSEAL